MVRRSVPTKKLYEAAYPWRVDVEVPPQGLGRQINDMGDWCQERFGGNEGWAQHGHMEKRPGEIPIDYARYYFQMEADALAFAARWGGTISERK